MSHLLKPHSLKTITFTSYQLFNLSELSQFKRNVLITRHEILIIYEQQNKAEY